MAPAPAALDYGNRTVVNFQRVPGYPFKINTGTRVAVYHISDTPIGVFHLHDNEHHVTQLSCRRFQQDAKAKTNGIKR